MVLNHNLFPGTSEKKKKKKKKSVAVEEAEAAPAEEPEAAAADADGEKKKKKKKDAGEGHHSAFGQNFGQEWSLCLPEWRFTVVERMRIYGDSLFGF